MVKNSSVSELRSRFALAFLVVYVAVWLLLAIDPWYRDDWLLENVLVFLLVPLLVKGSYRAPLSIGSNFCIFVFLCLHAIGSHYTYAQVPYDKWMHEICGTSLAELFDLQRNHFDRLVHFLYGLLLTLPLREVLLRFGQMRPMIAYLLPITIVMSTSMIFELFEWGAAIIFAGDLGIAYLGTQGDIWDAHQDMFLATCGTLIATLIIYLTRAFGAGARET